MKWSNKPTVIEARHDSLKVSRGLAHAKDEARPVKIIYVCIYNAQLKDTMKQVLGEVILPYYLRWESN